MSEPRDMDAPVTRREMHEALETWAAVIIDNMIDKMTDKMTSMVAASEQRLTSMIVSLSAAMTAMEARLMGELGRATKSSEDELTTRVRVVDEQYKDLPARVTKLEAKVFAPRKRSVATGRARKRS